MSTARDEEFNERGVDRRAALRKAAVAGTLVWTAPVVMSQSASAQTACTLSCAPPDGQRPQVNIVANRRCLADDSRVWIFEGILSPTVITCPCGVAAAVVEVEAPPVGTIIATDPGNQNLVLDVPVVVRITCLSNAGVPVSRSCAAITATNDFDGGTCVPTRGFVFQGTSVLCDGAPTCS